MSFDPQAATAAYIDALGADALAKAAAYTAGNHWLLLWGLLVSAACTWVIVRWGVLDRLAARLGRRSPNQRAFLISVVYFVLATHANAMAARLREILQRAGVPLAVDSPSNQVFPVLPDAMVERLRSFVEFETWERRGDGTTVIRLMTSWATPESDIEAFAATFSALYTEGRAVGAAQQAQGA